MSRTARQASPYVPGRPRGLRRELDGPQHRVENDEVIEKRRCARKAKVVDTADLRGHFDNVRTVIRGSTNVLRSVLDEYDSARPDASSPYKAHPGCGHKGVVTLAVSAASATAQTARSVHPAGNGSIATARPLTA